MKKRICLVGFNDDDPAQLEALKLTLSGISNAWESAFVPDMDTALAALRTGPFDAVVTRMRLRGANGAELLQQAGRLHPKTLRFVVGDVADQELIINCIGGTHQFIAEPCNPQTLIATVQRGLALNAWLSTDELQQLVPRLHRLPSLPSTYFEVLKQIESPSATVQNIGEVIARDPAVTARLLQMVNSAAFALDEKVTDPVQAVSLLGMETVKALVLCLQVFSQNDHATQAGLSFDQLWRHSSTVAEFARQITLIETQDPRLANDAFTAGLLHDVGRILIASNLPKEYAALVAAAREHSSALEDEEARQLGVTHAQVGAYLLALWGMPATLVEAAALHHIPSQTATREFSLLTAVHVANVFAHERGQCPAGLSRPKLDLAYLGTLGLEVRLDVWQRAIANEGQAATTGQTIKQTARAASNSTLRETSTGSGHGLFRFLIPATAGLVVAAIVVWWLRESHIPQPLDVHARTPALPSSVQPLPTIEPAPAAVELLTPIQPPLPPAADVAPPTNAMAIVRPAASAEVPPETKPLPPPPRGVDAVKVQGIVYGRNPTVFINGKALSVGGKVGDVEVVAIGPSSVTLKSDGQEKTLQFK